MCVFVNTLTKHGRGGAGGERKQNILLTLRPTEKTEYYRLRLINFSTSKNDRGSDFIVRYVHLKWGKNDKGKSIVESRVVCPVTKYVKWSGNRYEDCPICKFANNNFIAFKKSGYTDKESARKNHEFSRHFEAYVPVYVINDPVYESNNGKLKVICFTDRDEYQKFYDLAVKTAKERGVNVCNAKDAVDFCIRIARVNEVRNEGKPNEYVWSHNVIKKMDFTSKPHTIPEITSELIDEFPYDDEYYVSSSPEELKEFYDKYCRKKFDDDDDLDMSGDDEENADIPEIKEIKQEAPKVKKTAPVSEVENVLGDDDDLDMSDDDEDDIPFDDEKTESKDEFEKLPFDDEPAEKPIVKKSQPVQLKEENSVEEIDVDKMLAELDLQGDN